MNVRTRLAALPSIRRAARELDLHVGVWTVTNRVTAQLLALFGVDAITSDRSEILGQNDEPR